MPAQSHEQLRVWQVAMDLVVETYRVSSRLPGNEMYGLTSQMRRAAVSVPANIAEGHARDSTKEYLRHLSISLGSLAELKTHVELAVRLGFVPREDVSRLRGTADETGRILHAIRRTLKRKLADP